MSDNALHHELLRFLKGRIAFAEPLKQHTSWRIGGPAEIFVEPAAPGDLVLLTKWAGGKGLPLYVLGNGTNVLVLDSGVKGIVVKLGKGFNHIEVAGSKIISGAAASLPGLARTAANNGLGGLEFAIGIPGTLGGALVMNAGAHGASIGDFVVSLRAVTTKGEVITRGKEGLSFGYRASSLQGTGQIVIEAVLECCPREKDAINKDMITLLAGRKKNQPLDYPNAGSVFKNPEGRSAGQIIDECGCKGMTRGGAQVSAKHANFIINTGNATADDVLYLIEQVRKRVFDNLGIELKTEIKIWGDTL